MLNIQTYKDALTNTERRLIDSQILCVTHEINDGVKGERKTSGRGFFPSRKGNSGYLSVYLLVFLFSSLLFNK